LLENSSLAAVRFSPVAMKLLLEDGTEMSGRAFGAMESVGGA